MYTTYSSEEKQHVPCSTLVRCDENHTHIFNSETNGQLPSATESKSASKDSSLNPVNVETKTSCFYAKAKIIEKHCELRIDTGAPV